MQNWVLIVFNMLSVICFVFILVFVYVVFSVYVNGWGVVILVFSGVLDWVDGKIVWLLNQLLWLGVLLDLVVDCFYMVIVFIVFGLSGIVLWWFVFMLLICDVLLVGMLLLLWSCGLLVLLVIYVGKVVIFGFMVGFLIILLG